MPTLVDAPNPPKTLSAKRAPPLERSLPEHSLQKKPRVTAAVEDIQKPDSSNVKTVKTPDTPTKMKLRQRNQVLRQRISRIRKRLATSKRIQTKKAKINAAIKSVSNVLCGPIKDFFIPQIKKNSILKKGLSLD